MSTATRQPTGSPQRSLTVWLATGLGVGLAIPAPGTVGTALWGLPLAWLIGRLPNAGWQLAVIGVLIGIGIPICSQAGRLLGGKKDNQAIVWDEIVTMPIVFLLVPLSSWSLAVLGFLLHRIMDITKIPPAWQLERLPDGLGVMADDVMASLYACLALAGLVWLDGATAWYLLAIPPG